MARVDAHRSVLARRRPTFVPAHLSATTCAADRHFFPLFSSRSDNWEWAEGNTARFGVCYIDYDHGLKRHPKDSAWAMKKYFEDRIDKSQAA